MKMHDTPLRLLNLAVALFAALAASAAPVSTCFTYQGRLRNNNGTLITAPQDFRVTLYPLATGGSPVGSPSVNQTNCVPVVNGLFTLTLCFGDPSSYRCEARWLEIAVRPCGSSTFQVLTQRVELLPTPNAIQSLVACSVASNGVSAGSIPNSTITSNKIASGQVVKSLNGLHDDVKLLAGNNVTLTPSGQNLEISAAGGPAIWSLNGANAYYSGGGVGIGTTSPQQQLSVADGLNIDQANGNSGTVVNTLRFGSGSGEAIGSKRTPGDSQFGLDFYTASIKRMSILNDGNVAILSPGSLRWSSGSALGDDQGGAIELGNSLGNGNVPYIDFHYGVGSNQDYNVRLINDTNGWLTVGGNLRASGNLNVAGNLSFGAQTRQMINLFASAYGIGVQPYTHYFRTDAGASFAWYEGGVHINQFQDPGSAGRRLLTLDSQDGLHLETGDTDGPLTGFTVDDLSTLFRLGADRANSYYFRARKWDGFGADWRPVFLIHGDGQVGIGTDNPVAPLHVVSTRYSAGDNTATFNNPSLGPYASHVHFGTSGDWYIRSASGSGKVIIQDNGGSVGIGTSSPQAPLDVVGMTRTRVLQITGGSDIAEPFEMSDCEIPKGSLVVIDEENPGKLKLAGEEYDTRVAGIVSGANGVNPGISLHQEGLIEGGQNVALSGRVYALADATNGSIKPGDLLTSSSTPGHVMKATDHTRAQGAIVGKAMSALKEGKGMVLVLVSLQ